MTTTTDRRDLRRALDVERGLLAAAAGRAEPHPLGLLLFDATRPRVWVHNQLHVTGPAGDIDDLIGVLEEHYGQRDHRRVIVEDAEEGERLAEGFRGRGWQVERHVYMALRGPRDREPDAALAAEIDADEHRAIEALTIAEASSEHDAETTRQLLDARAARRAACDAAHCIGGYAEGRPAGTAALYCVGDTAQVEDVATVADLRGRGVARAMVSLAVDLAAGAELIWLAADDDDWPKELYAKLGFRPIGRIWVFTRTPAQASAPHV